MFHIIFTPLNLYCPSALQEDIKKLSYITKRQHMIGSELMENFQTSQFTVRMSRDTYSQLRQQKKFLSERKHAILWNIIQASKTRLDELDRYINHKIFFSPGASLPGRVRGHREKQEPDIGDCRRHDRRSQQTGQQVQGLLWAAKRTR